MAIFSEIRSLFSNTKSNSVTFEASQSFGKEARGPYCSLEQLMLLRLNARKLRLPKANKIARPQTGMHRSRFRGRGMEFSEVRAYQPGDDVRSIDWRVTARRQTPHTKLFNEERERPIFILCDQSQSQFFGSQQTFKSVRAAETAALFAWTALEHNDRVGGLVFSECGHQEIKPARSRKNIMGMLSTICRFNHELNIARPLPEKIFGLNDALLEMIRLVKPGTLIILISDFRHVSAETEKHLTQLAKHNELILSRTFDPIEEHLPPPGIYPVSNGDETLVINSSSSQARSEYDHWAKIHSAKLEEMSQRYRAPLVHISTQENPIHALRSVLVSVGGG